MVKYKKRLRNLQAAQQWRDKLPQKVKNATKRPGSIKQRIITGH